MRDSLRRLEGEIYRCRACPRLVTHREKIAREKRRAYREQEYWGRPVPGFGDPAARLVIVGLAPGAHGSNRTGRMFTGDSSGDTLYAALHRFGFASTPAAISRRDGLELADCFITAAARCAPPGNKPTAAELSACRPFLLRELRLLRRAHVYLALGRVAFEVLLRALAEAGIVTPNERPRFRHDGAWRLNEIHLLASYHPSRQNTQTGRLTRAMFDRVFRRARRLVG